MAYFTKKFSANLFFFILSLLIVRSVYQSELEFVAKFLYILGLVSCVALLTNSCLKKNFTRENLIKRLLLFLFASISLNTLTYQPFYSKFFAQDILLSNGLLLFVNYLLFAHLLDLGQRVSSYIVLSSFIFIPLLTLAKYYYTAETYATFGFLLTATIALRFIYKFGRDNGIKNQSV